MKAVVCKEFGPPEKLVFETVDDPAPGEGEVVVDVRAAAITFPDTLIIENRYQFKATPPFVLGGEVAGKVSAVGPGVTDFAVGDDATVWVASGVDGTLTEWHSAGDVPTPSRSVNVAPAGAPLPDALRTREARAELPNPKGQLRPGQFVRVKVAGFTRPNSIVVPQRAVQQGPRGAYAHVRLEACDGPFAVNVDAIEEQWRAAAIFGVQYAHERDRSGPRKPGVARPGHVERNSRVAERVLPCRHQQRICCRPVLADAQPVAVRTGVASGSTS